MIRAGVGDALVDTEDHLLVVVRIIREYLLHECSWGRGEDLAGVEVVLDLVDLHVLPKEAEELVWVEFAGGVVHEGGDRGTRESKRSSLSRA